LQNEEFHYVFISPDTGSVNKTWWMKSTGPMVWAGWKRIAYRTLVGWEDSNNIDLKELGWGFVACIRLA
jgi:hypothetical protein